MSKKEIWEPCPRCNSNRVEARGGCFFFLLGLGLASISIWITFLFLPAGIVGVVLGLLLMLSSPLMRKMLQCQDCKKAWKHPHKQEVN